jgi:hypothetical protein
VTSLHIFAKRVLNSIQHTDHMDAGESHYSQVFAHTPEFFGLIVKKMLNINDSNCCCGVIATPH